MPRGDRGESLEDITFLSNDLGNSLDRDTLSLNSPCLTRKHEGAGEMTSTPLVHSLATVVEMSRRVYILAALIVLVILSLSTYHSKYYASTVPPTDYTDLIYGTRKVFYGTFLLSYLRRTMASRDSSTGQGR
jgi:hypothetical protein